MLDCYFLIDDEVLELQKKYNITIFRPFNKNTQYEGLKHILPLTVVKLTELYDADPYHNYISQESHRFLVYLLDFQQHYRAEWNEYYQGILDCFHKLGFLTFKENIISYKRYFHKDILLSLVFIQSKHSPHNIQHYRTTTDLKKDLGFAIASKILRQKSIYDAENIPPIIEIENIYFY